MKTLRISRRGLVFSILALIALVGVILAIGDLDRSTRAEAAEAAAVIPGVSSAEVAAATEAAGHALAEALRFDHAEGQEAWSARVEPLCTATGWAFWRLAGAQTWPQVIEQEYTAHEVEVREATPLGAGLVLGSVAVEVETAVTYTLGDGAPMEEIKTNQVVMVQQDGQWLMDAPPEDQ